MTSRTLPIFGTDPNISGQDYAQEVHDSVNALWSYSGGVLTGVNFVTVNQIEATLVFGQGFTAYTDGLRVAFVASETNTGAMTIKLRATGSDAYLAAKQIKTLANTALVGGEVVDGRFYELVFVAAQDCFVLIPAFLPSDIADSGINNAPLKNEYLVAKRTTSQASTNIIIFEFDLQAESGDYLFFGERDFLIKGFVSGSGQNSNNFDIPIRFYIDGVLISTPATMRLVGPFPHTVSAIRNKIFGNWDTIVVIPDDANHTYRLRIDAPTGVSNVIVDWSFVIKHVRPTQSFI